MARSAEGTGGLNGRVALVTGASRGIGRAVVERLAEAGARVVLVARSDEPLQAAAATVGGTALRADVSSAEDVARLATELSRMLGGGAPDILVNAAGAFGLAPLAETEPEDFDRQLAVNLRGPFMLIRALLPGMLVRGSGHIVTIGSIAGRHAFPHNGAYSASKFGVRGLHGVLDAELRGSGVRATLVEPAATNTELWDAIDFERHPGLPPRSAMLEPGAVADAVHFAVTRPPDMDVRTIILDRT